VAILTLMEKALVEQKERDTDLELSVKNRMTKRRYMKDKREYLDDGGFWK
jgi:hypothetical protein